MNFTKIRLALLLILTMCCGRPVIAQDYSRSRVDSLLSSLSQARDDEKRMNVLFDISRTFWRYHPDSSITYAQKQLEIAERTENRRERQRAVNTIGYMLEIKGDYAQSWKYRKQDERLSAELKDSTGLAFAYYGLGNLSMYIGNYPEALDYHIKAMRIREKQTDKYQLGWSYTNIGYVYSLQGLAEQAIDYRKKALECFSTPGLQNVRARDNVMRFLAEDYIIRKEYDQALTLYSDLLAIKRKRGDPLSQLAYTEEEIGWVLFLMGSYNEAINHFKHALAAMRSSDIRREPLTLNRLAKAYLANRQFGMARETANQALSIGRRQNRPDVVSEAKWILAEEAEINGRLNEAIVFLKSYWAIRDSIFSSENQLKVAARETAYEVEKKQREIEQLEQQNEVQELEIKSQKLERNLLIIIVLGVSILALSFGWMFRLRQQQNKELERAMVELESSRTEISKRNAELERLNLEKDYFFSIIGHDLRNPFLGVLGFSSILRDDVSKLSKEEIAEIANKLHNKSTEVLNLLGNLLEWAKLELGSDPARLEPINMAHLIDQAVNLYAIDLKAKNIRVSNQIETGGKLFSDPNVLSIVLRNLLSNAIKFSFPDSEILITAFRTTDTLVMSVVDTGIGMSDEKVNALFKMGGNRTSPGTAMETGTGLGLILCQRYAEKAGGQLTVESSPGKGTRFSLSIPATNQIIT